MHNLAPVLCPCLLLLLFHFQDDADGKEVVDTLEGTVLLLHLLPDAVDALGTPLDVEVQTGLGEALADGLDEALDVGVATLLGLAEFFLDMVVGVVLEVFERQVLQLTLQLIQTQLVGQGSIEIGSLLRHLMLGIGIVGVLDLAHQIDAVGNHDEDDAHVLGKRQKQVAEILGLDNGILLVEFLDALQSVQDAGDGLTKMGAHLVDGQQTLLNIGAEQYGQHAIAAKTNLVDHQLGGLETEQDGVQAKHVAIDLLALQGFQHQLAHALLVALHQ